MLITIRGTAPTDVLDEGEERTVELTPYVRGLIRNGLAVQVPGPVPEPVSEPAPRARRPRRGKRAAVVVEAEEARTALVDARAAARTELAELADLTFGKLVVPESLGADEG